MFIRMMPSSSPSSDKHHQPRGGVPIATARPASARVRQHRSSDHANTSTAAEDNLVSRSVNDVLAAATAGSSAAIYQRNMLHGNSPAEDPFQDEEDDVLQSVTLTNPVGPNSTAAGGECAAAPRSLHGLQCELRRVLNEYSRSSGAASSTDTPHEATRNSGNGSERDCTLITQLDAVTVEVSELLLGAANISAGDASALSEIIHSVTRVLPTPAPQNQQQQPHSSHLAASILNLFHIILCNVNGIRVGAKAVREHMTAVVAWMWAVQRDSVPAAKLACSVVSIIVTYADDGVDVVRGVLRNARIHFEERAIEYVRAAGCGGAVANMVSMLRVLLSTTPPPPPEDVESIVRIADAVAAQLAASTLQPRQDITPKSSHGQALPEVVVRSTCKENAPIAIELLHFFGTAALVLDGNESASAQQQEVHRCYTQHLRGVVDHMRRSMDRESVLESSTQTAHSSQLHDESEAEADALTHYHLLLLRSFADTACGVVGRSSSGGSTHSPVQQHQHQLLALSTRTHADPSSNNDMEGRARTPSSPTPPPPLLNTRQSSSPDSGDAFFGGALCDVKKLHRELREVQRARLDDQKQLSAFNNAAVVLLSGAEDKHRGTDRGEDRRSLAAFALCLVPGGLRTLFTVLSSVDEVTSTRACTVLAAVLEAGVGCDDASYTRVSSASSQGSASRPSNAVRALASSYRDTLVQDFVLMAGLPLLAEMLDDYALPVLVGATRVVHAILRVSQSHNELSAMRHLCCTYKCIARIGTSVIPALNRPDESSGSNTAGALDATAAVLDGFKGSPERLEALQYCVSIARMLSVEEARNHMSDEVVAALNHVIIACRAHFPPAAAVALHGLEALAPAFPTIVAASLDLEYFRCVTCGDADGVAVFGTPLAEEMLQTMLRCMGTVVSNLPYIVTYEWVEALHAALKTLSIDSSVSSPSPSSPSSGSARAAMWRAFVATLAASPESADFILGDDGDDDGVMQRVDAALEHVLTSTSTSTAAEFGRMTSPTAHLANVAKEEELVWLLLLASFATQSSASPAHLEHINQLAQIMSFPSPTTTCGNSASVFPHATLSSTTSTHDSPKSGRKSRCGSSNILLRQQHQQQQPMRACVPYVSNRMRLAWVPYLRGLLQRLCRAAAPDAPDVNRQRRIAEAVEALFYTVFYVDDDENENDENAEANSRDVAGSEEDMNVNAAAVVHDVDAASKETYFRNASAPILAAGMHAMLMTMSFHDNINSCGSMRRSALVADVRSERVARAAFATLTECAPHSVTALCAMARESVQILLSATDSDSYSADAAHDRLVALGPLINGVLFTAPPHQDDQTTAEVVSALASQLLSLAAFRALPGSEALTDNTVNAALLDMLTAPFFTVALRLLCSGLSGDDATLKSLSDRLYGSPSTTAAASSSGIGGAIVSGASSSSARPFLLTLSTILDQFLRRGKRSDAYQAEDREDDDEEAQDAMDLLRAAMDATEQLLLARRATEAVLMQDELLPAFLVHHVLPNMDVHECQSLFLFCLQWTSVQRVLVLQSREAYVAALQYIAAAGTAAASGNGNGTATDAQLRYTTLIANKYLTDLNDL